MGVQICIEREVLEAAGWECRISKVKSAHHNLEGAFVCCGDTPCLKIRKNGNIFHSLRSDCFFVKCTDDQHSKQYVDRLKAAGLFDLEHTEG